MADSFVQVPPDSTGKKLGTRQHTLSGNVVQAPLQHIVSGDNPANALTVDSRGAASVRFTEGQPIMSSYGSLKTERERTLGVYEASLDSYDDLFSIQSTLGGTSAYDTVKSSTVLSTTTASGSAIKRTTNRYHYYLPGTSNLARISVACGDTGKVGNKRRWGLYDDFDGIFFELDGTSLRSVIRSSTSGSVTESPIPRVAWTDKLDGTGISLFNLDLTKVNNYWADYTFSGAGRVRFGVYEPNGTRLTAYTIQVGNAYPFPSIRTGTLPFRTENINTAATGSVSELREVAMSMSTEGDPGDYTFWRSADMEVFGVATTTDSHVLSLKSLVLINGKHNAVQAYPEMLNVLVTGGAIALSLWQDTTITAPSWVIGNGTSSLQGSSAGTLTYPTARKFNTLFLAEGAHRIDMRPYFEVNDEGVMCRADGTSEIWSFTATKLTGTTVTTGLNLCYRELW